ncbi:LysR family transcriptional regulator [Brevibacterium album]|uniref:LysR family transcriptional regulator n=1 Tax=Brevibacterium album TaxID=417948 RepID=UPI00040A2645|nr:LysR family transcriptional regulator [Brevibacterium album]
MSPDFTLVQLRYFQAVARCENMTAAAAELSVSQSAVSTAMAQLERALGVDLFIRQPNRSIVLSAAGRRLAAEADEFLESAEALTELAHGLTHSLSGRLRMGVFAPTAPTFLPALHQEFIRRHPGVELTYLEADLSGLRTALAAGECDAALMYTLGLDGTFARSVFSSVPPHVLVAEDHPRAGGSARLHDFADEPYIELGMPHSRQYYEQLFRLVGVTPRTQHVFEGYETVRAFVAQGHGYTILNQRITAMTYAGTRVATVALLDDLPPIDFAVAWPRSTALNRRARAFRDLCHEMFG